MTKHLAMKWLFTVLFAFAIGLIVSAALEKVVSKPVAYSAAAAISALVAIFLASHIRVRAKRF